MKDYFGTKLELGDKVAVVNHYEEYKFCLSAAVLTKRTEKTLYMDLMEGGTRKNIFRDDETLPMLVKLPEDYKPSKRKGPKDAVGQPMKIGDKVALQRPIELGSTCKGFEYGGVITKITDQFVTVELDGQSKRKKFNGVVVMNV